MELLTQLFKQVSTHMANFITPLLCNFWLLKMLEEKGYKPEVLQNLFSETMRLHNIKSQEHMKSNRFLKIDLLSQTGL